MREEDRLKINEILDLMNQGVSVIGLADKVGLTKAQMAALKARNPRFSKQFKELREENLVKADRQRSTYYCTVCAMRCFRTCPNKSLITEMDRYVGYGKNSDGFVRMNDVIDILRMFRRAEHNRGYVTMTDIFVHLVEAMNLFDYIDDSCSVQRQLTITRDRLEEFYRQVMDGEVYVVKVGEWLVLPERYDVTEFRMRQVVPLRDFI